jgi:hypothetical protein
MGSVRIRRHYFEYLLGLVSSEWNNSSHFTADRRKIRGNVQGVSTNSETKHVHYR